MFDKKYKFLLVDDDEGTNFYHEIIIEETGIAEEVLNAEDGEEALSLIQHLDEEKLPNIILLDLNMPRMNGWEFLANFEKLPKSMRERMNVIILTTSFNSADREAARNYPDVKLYKNKLLNEDMLKEIISVTQS